MARDLRPLFDPRSVAIVGASDDPAKWGNWLGRGALRGEHRRPVYLVNRNGGSVLGRTAYASLLDVPEPPELVVVAVPAAAFEQTVGDALSAGAGGDCRPPAGPGGAGGGAPGASAGAAAPAAGRGPPPLSAGLATALAEMLPHTAATRNPVD